MLRQNRATTFNRRDESCSDPTLPHMRGQRIDRGLPFEGMHFLRHAFIGDDPRVVLGHGHEDQDPAAIACAANPAQHELLERRAMGPSTLYRPRHQQNPQRRPGECDSGNEEDDELHQENALHAPLREIDQRPRREQRQKARPQNGNVRIGG